MKTSISSSKALLAIGATIMGIAMLAGPLFSPSAFSWVRHTTSEQAAQGMAGAWIMQLGFAGYGCSVIAVAALTHWLNLWSRICLGLFGAGLVATAVWSNKAIAVGVTSDLFEDWLHSVASGVVGAAFALFCLFALAFEQPRWRNGWTWTGLFMAILIPLGMNLMPDVKGVLQRAMFIYSLVVFVCVIGIAPPANRISGDRSS